MPNSGNVLVFILIVVVAIAILYLLSSGGYTPGVAFTITPDHIQIKNNQFSQIITIKVTKTDDANKPTAFLIKLSSEANGVYAISVNNNQTISEYMTKPLIDRDASDTLQFKVFGTLPEGYSPATTYINAQLLYNNTTMQDKVVTLTIDITS